MSYKYAGIFSCTADFVKPKSSYKNTLSLEENYASTFLNALWVDVQMVWDEGINNFKDLNLSSGYRLHE
jgi:hypothetical protein